MDTKDKESHHMCARSSQALNRTQTWREKLTRTFPALVRRRRVAQDKHDENKTSSDQSRPDPVNAPVFLRRWFVFFKNEKSQNHEGKGDCANRKYRCPPGGSVKDDEPV